MRHVPQMIRSRMATTATTPPSTCRSCGAAIVWATSERTGKHMPFVQDDTAGEWVITDGKASHQGTAPASYGEHTLPRYKSHFADCPQAEQWRRPR